MSETADVETVPVAATGVESELATRSETTIGHVTMIDVDGDATPALSDVEELAEEVSVRLRTRGGAHLYGLRPLSWSDVAGRLDDSAIVDPEYAEEMRRRERATLRVSAERTPELTVSSPPPEVEAVRIPPTASIVSGPHARTLERLAADGSAASEVLDALAEGDVDGVESVGELVVRSTYRTRELGGI